MPILRTGRLPGLRRRRVGGGLRLIILLLGFLGIMRRLALLVAALLLLLLPSVPPLGSGHGFGGTTHGPPGAAGSARLRPVTVSEGLRPELRGGTAEQIVYPNDSALAPATGVETNITQFTPISMPPLSSFQVSLAVVLGTVEVVFGIFQNTGHAPTAFRAEFSNRTDNYTSLAYWTNFTLQVDSSYGFALMHGGGTNWTLSIDGQPFGGSAANATTDCGVSAITWDRGVSFSVNVAYGPSTYVPATVGVPLAFATFRAGSWYLPQLGQATEIGSAGSPWGIQGRAQHATLAPGELASGPLIAPVANNTTLWTGGPVPIDVALQLSAATAPAFAAVGVTAVVTDGPGAPLPSVPLGFFDSNASTFFPAETLTNASGGAISAFTAPNASAASTDTVHVVVEILGYQGSAVGTVQITPAVELLLSPGSVPSRINPGATASVTFFVRTMGGAPVAGVAVLFTLSGPGAVEPVAAASDSGGAIPVSVVSDGQRAPLEVLAKVAQPGYWGHGSARLDVATAPPTLNDRLQPYFLPVGVAIVVAAILVVWWWRRRPRGELPPLKLPAYRWRGRGPSPP
ncbi:MAG TPA: hypothetical protein VGU43_00435 [Thermoplasmata archaeon]|nr:hypothetical protein [Thermoplasmata archaeon]